MPQPLIYHIDVNSAFLSWEAAELLRQDPDAPDIRSFPSVHPVGALHLLCWQEARCPIPDE